MRWNLLSARRPSDLREIFCSATQVGIPRHAEEVEQISLRLFRKSCGRMANRRTQQEGRVGPQELCSRFRGRQGQGLRPAARSLTALVAGKTIHLSTLGRKFDHVFSSAFTLPGAGHPAQPAAPGPW